MSGVPTSASGPALRSNTTVVVLSGVAGCVVGASLLTRSGDLAAALGLATLAALATMIAGGWWSSRARSRILGSCGDWSQPLG